MEQSHSDYNGYRDIRLADDVITLRKFTPDDAEDMLAGEDDENVKWLQGGEKSTLESTRRWIEKSSSMMAWQFYDHYTFAIEDNESGKLAGMIDVNAMPDKESHLQEGEANIAYSIHPEFRGKGYAPRAVQRVLIFLSSQHVERALIRVNPENASSVRVAEKCGFTKSGKEWSNPQSGEHFIEFSKDLQHDSYGG